MKYTEITEKDLEADEKKVFGKLIDMWSLGGPKDPYEYSTKSKILKLSESDGLSKETVLKILQSLQERELIQMAEVNGTVHVKYMANASHIVKELQKTTYVNSRIPFKPPHH